MLNRVAFLFYEEINMQSFNFSAGPAMLPADVMQQAQAEFLDWQGCGSSVMEISHRSKEFIAVAEKAEQDLRDLLAVPDNYKVLFMHGGGRGGFASVPMNLSQPEQTVAHLVTGSWSKGAVTESAKYANTHIIGTDVLIDGQKTLSKQTEWEWPEGDIAYLHYCPNETVEGFQIAQPPTHKGINLVADMSSNILSKPININDYACIYAGAQKNIGPSGLAIVIVHEDLLGQAQTCTPSIMNYAITAEYGSMYNTPPTYAWYLSGLVFQWLKDQGGLAAIEQINQQKAQTLYQLIDQSSFYQNNIAPQHRSIMNVVFNLPNSELETLFVKEAAAAGLHALKGHRSVGGIRASIYNAMPLAGVETLAQFMLAFEQSKG